MQASSRENTEGITPRTADQHWDVSVSEGGPASTRTSDRRTASSSGPRAWLAPFGTVPMAKALLHASRYNLDEVLYVHYNP
ncbi:hypothetical protein VTI74DRAFT_2286 [Chaetomium olivicolor]